MYSRSESKLGSSPIAERPDRAGVLEAAAAAQVEEERERSGSRDQKLPLQLQLHELLHL